ncbi:MAG: hypothetical protein O2820_10860 [Planctomycetota bacterium]|nr:hypothetical protein [Planctomycetota bacterium]MDA1249709.1 hypothetical protein [Planctomycetota bacterium]
MAEHFTDDELLSWLDEQLPVDRLAELEQSMRDSETLRHRMAALIRRRDQGEHSVGEIWRRNRLSCPDRETLGSWLLESLDESLMSYIEFHLKTIGCRFCNASLDELEAARSEVDSTSHQRRRRFFESSAGLLRRDEDS